MAEMTVREMRNKLFQVDNQKELASKYYPREAKSGETVEQMRHRLFGYEPQDAPFSKANPIRAYRQEISGNDRRGAPARLHRALDAVMDGLKPERLTLEPQNISRVYSGRPGCMCGCRGNYSTNPAQITRVCNVIKALGGQSTPDWHTAETPTRSYTAYLKAGKYAKDVRPAHDAIAKDAHADLRQRRPTECVTCNGSGRLKSTGGKCDICGGSGRLAGGGKEPMQLRKPGTPSGWGEGHRTGDGAAKAKDRVPADCLDCGVLPV